MYDAAVRKSGIDFNDPPFVHFGVYEGGVLIIGNIPMYLDCTKDDLQTVADKKYKDKHSTGADKKRRVHNNIVLGGGKMLLESFSGGNKAGGKLKNKEPHKNEVGNNDNLGGGIIPAALTPNDFFFLLSRNRLPLIHGKTPLEFDFGNIKVITYRKEGVKKSCNF